MRLGVEQSIVQAVRPIKGSESRKHFAEDVV
jgi:hypothetical protein